MAKIAYNACYGGFSLSHEGMMRYGELRGTPFYPEKDPKYDWLVTYWTVPEDQRPQPLEDEDWYRATQDERIAHNKALGELTCRSRDISRADPHLIAVIEELGDRANGPHAHLQIAEVPDGGKYRIDEYDGNERVETPDSYDWEIA